MPNQTHGWTEETSPFHAGEQTLQERVGMRDEMERFGRRVIRDYLPDQHRTFFGQLPYVVVGHVDDQGWPWATMLAGKEGFLKSPDPRTLTINARPHHPDDPLTSGLSEGAPLGLLGIELATRRRNRLNARISKVDADGMELTVDQSFGNCPQYIQTRTLEFVRDPSVLSQGKSERISSFDEAARDLIRGADTFFVASYITGEGDPRIEGVDVSHRGGQPGFVRVDGDTLTIPDYTGNFHFNTLGNFLTNPKAGLFFLDFESGEMLMLTGTVEIIWEGPEVDAFRGAERAWTFKLDHGIRLADALPVRWSFGEFSPNSLITGTWADAAATLAAEAKRAAWRSYKVVRVDDESDVIRSFYLEPEDGDGILSFEAGQYLTIKATPPGAEKPVIRTYTVSSAPADKHYRISVKREPARSEEFAPGLMSNHLHDFLKPGDMIEAKAPRGAFFIDAAKKRPAVLLAGGVGITPMISMVRHVAQEGLRTRHTRPVTLIHSAQTTKQRAFFEEANSLSRQTNGAVRYLSIIDRPTDAEEPGVDYNGTGRINAEILKQALSFDDHDFFLCGPPPFMQGLYDTLRDLGVRDMRIFAEAFGPASLNRRPDANIVEAEPDVAEAEEALVRFDKSEFEQRWNSSDGTLLELAEDHGLTPDYGCRSGACGSCAVAIKQGAVAYRSKPSITPPEGHALICCSVPAAGEESLVLDL
jgi:ferredoxin-NADP reductase/predicted pyridoxine 5'-phosphate oxidase superfamily flavin-nucleotide-binding protein